METTPTARPEGWSANVPASQYQIRRRLGEGGFGEVFEAWDNKLRRSVALKQLKPLSIVSGANHLLAEARLSASLKHSAFVKIFAIDAVGDDGAQSIVMELVEGETLGQFGAIRTVTHDQALDIAAQVADALHEAHQAKLVHGDIKPSNLMLEASGKVRILDFGLARQIDRQATESVLLTSETQGTVAYLAPERLMGQASSPHSDMYSLGAVLYELIAGQRPFPELRGLALAAAHLNSSSAAWPFAPDCGPAIVALVRAMTAKDPDQRPRSMQAVTDAIGAIRRGDTGAGLGLSLPAPQASLPVTRRFGLSGGRKWWLGLAIAVPLLGLGAWQAGLRAQVDKLMQAPYSEAAAMREGMSQLLLAARDSNADRAIASFNSILQHQPEHAAAAAGLSLGYSQRYFGDGGDGIWLQRADASAQQALLYNDQLALAHAALAWVRESKGRHEEALGIAEKALSLDPLNIYALRIKINLLIRLRHYDEAQRAINAAAKAYPKQWLFSDLLGKLHFKQSNYVAAEQAFRRSITLEPDAIYPYASLNQALLRQGRGDEALQVLQQGLQIRPNSYLYGNLGTALFARGDYHGAATAFEHAVSSSQGGPNLYLHWANLADTLRWIPGRETASRQAYQQAADLLQPRLERAPTDITFKSRMGLYRAKLGQRDVALQWTRDALQAAPVNADVHFRAAIAYEISGDTDNAVTQLIQARTLGYPVNLIDTEPDLLAVRRHARYHLLPPPKKAQDDKT